MMGCGKACACVGLAPWGSSRVRCSTPLMRSTLPVRYSQAVALAGRVAPSGMTEKSKAVPLIVRVSLCLLTVRVSSRRWGMRVICIVFPQYQRPIAPSLYIVGAVVTAIGAPTPGELFVALTTPGKGMRMPEPITSWKQKGVAAKTEG